MPLPIRFDMNEIFLIVMILIGIFIALKLPKKLPTSISIIIMLWSTVIARISDHLLGSAAAGAHLDFYDVIDSGKFELLDILPYVMFCPYAYILIYTYERLNIRRQFIPLFVLLMSIISVLFEFLTVIFKVYNYKNWSLLYSLSIYLFAHPLTLLFYHYIDYLFKKMKNSKV